MPPPFNQMMPPAPTFTEQHAGDQRGRVFIVTGSTSGIGLELAKIFYGLNGTVYVAARSEEKIRAAINTIKSEVRTNSGRVEALQLDLSNLASIGRAAQDFLAREERLDVLVHNAGLMTPPAGSKTKLGHDLEMGTNCLGPYLFTHYLEAVLKKTAASSNSPLGVRVVFVASMIASFVPQGGIIAGSDGQPKVLKNSMENYMQSKVGNVFLAAETARRWGNDGILSVSVHPGLLKTELQRHLPAVLRAVMGVMFKGPKYGAYSELFAALSPNITTSTNGAFIIPWGRFGPIPEHIQQSLKNGKAAAFYNWCDRETKPYQ